MEIDIDSLTPEVISELRILIGSPGWKIFEDLIRAQRFIFYDRNMNRQPSDSDSLEIYALKMHGENQYQAGVAFAISLPTVLVEQFELDKPEKEEPQSGSQEEN